MERAAWTDERLDDLAEAMRTGFARVDQDIRDLRGDVASLRDEMHASFAQLQAQINRLQDQMNRFGGGLLIAMLGVIAAILARGA